MQPSDYITATGRTDLSDAFYQDVALRAQNIRTLKLLHATVGLSTEAGEALDVLKKHLMYNRPIDEVNLAEEFGDALWYVARGLEALGFTFEQVMAMNINKLKKRFPEKFTEENAEQRDLFAEREQLEKDFKPSAHTHVID